MIYHSIDRDDYFKSVRIRVDFHGISHDHSVGTGFFVKKDDTLFFLTAAHVIGETHTQPLKRKDKVIKSCKLEVFVVNFETSAYHQKANEIQCKPDDFVVCQNENDLACVHIPINSDISYLRYVNFKDLATETELDNYNAGEPTYLSGYPPMSADLFEVGKTNIPIMRQSVFANLPARGFKIPGKLGNDYSYLDAFALGGFSGSPIICPQIGLNPNSDNVIKTKRYEPKRIVGMLVGSVFEEKNKDHSGLSYFVRSPSIIKLIEHVESI